MNGVPTLEPRTVMDLIDGGVSASTGVNPRMMWLILATLRNTGERMSRSQVYESLASAATPEEVQFFDDNPKTLRSLIDAARRALHDYDFIRTVKAKWELTALGWVTSCENELDFLTKEEAAEKPQAAPWQEQIVQRLHALSPAAFEHFMAMILEKAGVFDVEVDGRSGDGGIDGHGSMVQGPMSIPVFFQAKRYAGTVGSGVVRDFRGAVQGRGHVGMIFSTGLFSKDAHTEVERTQAVNIQLFDGPRIAEWMKELRMGVTVNQRVVEDVSLDNDWWKEQAANYDGDQA